MPEDKEKLDITNVRKEDFLEQAFEAYIPESRVHEKLGNIHGRKIKRLTDEEEEIIRRYRKFNLKDVPDNWQELLKRPDNWQEQLNLKDQEIETLKKRLEKVNDMLKVLKKEKENKT